MTDAPSTEAPKDRYGGEYVTDEAALLHEIRDCLVEVRDALREFLPYARAYLDPEQSGPRGWAIRRQLAKTNGRPTP